VDLHAQGFKFMTHYLQHQPSLIDLTRELQ